MPKRVAVVVYGHFVIPKPSYRFAHIFNRFTNISDDNITRLCVAQGVSHFLPYLRKNLVRKNTISRISVIPHLILLFSVLDGDRPF